ncbi:MAG: FecR protein [Paraburkholderia fungorum]|nr:FecR protein [Paraburkholderia fungorum]
MRTVTTPQHSKRRMTGYTLIAAAAFLFAAQATFAQEAEQAPPGAATQNTDPPGRVARLNYTAGAVTTEPAGATDWSYAQINRPLTTGDQLWNDQNARSELHIGSTAVRLDQSTSLDILNLDDNSAQLKVAQGTLSARVRELAPGSSYEIDTPNLALGLNGPGDYRVDVAPDGSSTTVTVRSGSATVYGDSGQVPVAAGQQVRFAGTNLQQVADNGAPGLDPFDQWAASRDAAEDRSVSARYVSRDIPGYQDLDANGTWQSSPQYGEVWVPRATPAGWAPYHDGHWVWQAPWGWTWVDDAPWGFAPYHYGRWAYVDDSWAWVPGPIVVSAPPVYAPALVAFVGGGGGGVNWGVSLAIGGAVAAGVAWFPLGPGEPWHPNWGGHNNWSPGYYNRVNNTTVVNNYNRNINVTNVNVTNIHNTYINYRAPGGVTAVPATAFVHGQPVGRFAQKVDPQQWRNAQINPGGPGIAPVKQSFGPGLRNANYRPPAAVMARPVVATRSPAVPAAYHDTLAQRFAQSGGRVPGAGEPIVRTSVPAHMAGAPGAVPVQNVRVVQSHMAGRTPGAAPGAPNGTQQGMQQAGQRPGAAPNAQPQRGGEPQARPGTPPQMANLHEQPGEAARPSNGVPHPPQANGANPNAYAQQHGAPGQAGQQAGAEARREPAWTQPHTPMAQQAQQHGAPQEQAHQPEGRPEPQQQAQRQPEAQAPRAPEVHAQPQQQPREEYRPQPQQAQQPRPEPRPQQVQQPRPEPRPQQVQQPRPEPRPQQVQQPRPEPRPQQVQQPRPEPRPQHEEQHSSSANRDEHHKS